VASQVPTYPGVPGSIRIGLVNKESGVRRSCLLAVPERAGSRSKCLDPAFSPPLGLTSISIFEEVYHEMTPLEA